MNEINRKIFKKNILFAFTAQFVSLLASVLISLIVPKMLGVEEFSYWQLFIFYSGYVGFFHFGLSDGIYLRYGGTDIDKLNKSLIKSQFLLMMLWQFIICLCVLPVVFITVSDKSRLAVWVSIAVYLLIANGCWFWGYVYQAANLTSVYSTSTIISKAVFILFIAVLLIFKVKRFEKFVILYVFAQFLAFMYSIIKSRSFFKQKNTSFDITFKETFTDIKIGINLTISNIASSLILGIGRIFVDATQEISQFGLISFAISLTNFFLQFISQVSMVLFPALRKVNNNKATDMFISLRRNSGLILCAILVLYIPMKKILLLWLPQYEVSLNYLAYLLPICIFDGKMQLVYSTYMKVLRKERSLLTINLISLFLSACLCAVSTFLLKDMICVIISMIIAIAVRSIISNVYLSKELKIPIGMELVCDIILSVVFIYTSNNMNGWVSLCICFVLYVLYLGYYRRSVLALIDSLKKN